MQNLAVKELPKDLHDKLEAIGRFDTATMAVVNMNRYWQGQVKSLCRIMYGTIC